MVVAGMPKYSGLFGRDAYLTALQTAILNPATLRGALETLTPFNATAVDDYRDAEPGKVLHQRQLGPLAKLDLSPFRAYYGDHSAPGLFLLAAARDFAQTGDARFLASIKDPLRRTLDWMEGNADHLGFYPYQTRSRMGLKNQSWKDSGDAVLYPDGTDVSDPIAMADIQALFYAAQQAIGLTFLEIGEVQLGERLLSRAKVLKKRFNRAFWMPNERFFAMALELGKAAGSQHRVRSGNLPRLWRDRRRQDRSRGRPPPRARHVQRLGRTDAVAPASSLQPVRLSPRRGLAIV